MVFEPRLTPVASTGRQPTPAADIHEPPAAGYGPADAFQTFAESAERADVASALGLSVRDVRAREFHALEDYLADAIERLELAPLSALPAGTVEAFARELPKIDLHCHLEGAIPPEVVLEVARAHGVELPADDLEGLRPHVQVNEHDRGLLDFLKKFDVIGKLFQSRAVIADLTRGVVAKLAADNVAHVELRFSPMYMALDQNLDLEEVIRGVADGVQQARARHDIGVRLIVIVERQMGVDPAEVVADLAARYQHLGVVALDLANDEYNYPPGPYAEVFQGAKRAGLAITVHAGEGVGPDNVWTSIDELGADRIGHGTDSIQDPELVQELGERGITLEQCPTSNLQTGTVDSLEAHPLREFLERGVPVTLNTDDPGVSGITCSGEWANVARRQGLSLHDVETLLYNGAASAFLSRADRSALVAKLRRGVDTAREDLLDSLSLLDIHRMALEGIDRLPISAREKSRVAERLNSRLLALLEEIQAASAP